MYVGEIIYLCGKPFVRRLCEGCGGFVLVRKGDGHQQEPVVILCNDCDWPDKEVAIKAVRRIAQQIARDN